MENLTQQLDDLELPSSFVQLEQSYMEECPSTCPLLVRWYRTDGSIESMRSQIVERLETSGVAVNEASASLGLFSAKSEDHIFFVVLDPEMLEQNANAPPGTNAEISVHVLSDDA